VGRSPGVPGTTSSEVTDPAGARRANKSAADLGHVGFQSRAGRDEVPDVRDGSLWRGWVRVSFNRAAPGHCWGSLAAWVGTQIVRAPGWISAKRVVDSPTTSPSSW
jgi:hypothetical protein